MQKSFGIKPTLTLLPWLFVVIACATVEVEDGWETGDGDGPTGGSTGSGGLSSPSGGQTAGVGGSSSPGSGGTTSTGGTASGGNTGSGGTAATGGDTGIGGTTGSGGTTASGGAPGAGGTTATGGTSGSGGSTIGSGDCEGVPAFVAGNGTKYALNELVTAICNGGTPCLNANPPGQNGSLYEFKCIENYNCGTQNPGTTNWSQPPWEMTRACN